MQSNIEATRESTLNTPIRKLGARKSVARPKVLDNQIRVSTPENISFQYEVVGPSRRLMAYLLDVMITLGAFTIAAIAVSFLFAWLASFMRGAGMTQLLDFLGGIAFAIFAIGGFITMWFYGAFMETRFNGQTFGKMMTNIRTISADGSAIDGTQATLRNFFRLLDVSPIITTATVFGADAGMVPIPLFSIGLLCMFLNGRYQRLGDFVAGTIVVSEQRKWTHGLAKFSDERVPLLAEMIPEDFVTPPSLATALAEYVERRQVLPYERANEIASHLSRPLLTQFALQSDTNPDLFLCALYYKTFVQHSDEESEYEEDEVHVIGNPYAEEVSA